MIWPLNDDRSLHTANVLVCVAGLATATSSIAGAAAVATGALSVKELTQNLPRKLRGVADSVAADLRARLDGDTRMPAERRALLHQMIADAAPDLQAIADAGQNSKCLLKAMERVLVARTDQPEYAQQTNLSNFRRITRPILEKLLNDPTFTAQLAPLRERAFWQMKMTGEKVSEQLDEVHTIVQEIRRDTRKEIPGSQSDMEKFYVSFDKDQWWVRRGDEDTTGNRVNMFVGINFHIEAENRALRLYELEVSRYVDGLCCSTLSHTVSDFFLYNEALSVEMDRSKLHSIGNGLVRRELPLIDHYKFEPVQRIVEYQSIRYLSWTKFGSPSPLVDDLEWGEIAFKLIFRFDHADERQERTFFFRERPGGADEIQAISPPPKMNNRQIELAYDEGKISSSDLQRLQGIPEHRRYVLYKSAVPRKHEEEQFHFIKRIRKQIAQE